MEEVRSLGSLPAPFGKEVQLQQVDFDNGFAFLRIRIREGSRFTIMDLDANTARAWGDAMSQWAKDNPLPADGD